jgi:hypothetical protein
LISKKHNHPKKQLLQQWIGVKKSPCPPNSIGAFQLVLLTFLDLNLGP